MVAITATNSATPSLQTGLGRARLEQARRVADQAEANARDLRAQADNAEQQASSSQGNVRKVAANNQREAATYSAPRASNVSDIPTGVQRLVEKMYATISDKRSQNGNPLKTDPNAAPVVNAQGQATGRILNISA